MKGISMINKLKDSINIYVESDEPVAKLIGFVIDTVMGLLFFYWIDVFNFNDIESYVSLSFIGKMFITLICVSVCNYIFSIFCNSIALLLKLIKKVFN